MHEGLNLNKSIFNMDAIESAKESVKNIPILAFVKQDDGSGDVDFKGHESQIVLSSDGDVTCRYLGRPIGVVPSDNNDYHYEIYDGKTYVVVDGYIWKDYANEALDILMRDGEKSQSMEIRVDDGYFDDNDNFNITSYRYTGLTLIGDNVLPAMVGAKCQVFEVQSEFDKDFYNKIDELNIMLKEYASKSDENEVNNMKENKDLELEVEDIAVEPTDEFVEETTDDVVEDVVVENSDEEVTVGENLDKSESSENDNFQEEDDVVEESSIDYEKLLTDKENYIFELNTQLSNLKSEYELLKAEIVELREYKSTNESEKSKGEKEAIFEQFSGGLTEDEMKPVKDEIDNLSVTDIKSKLNEIFTAKNLPQVKKSKFNADKDTDVVIDIAKKDTFKSSRYYV
jgi:hypothetical protein